MGPYASGKRAKTGTSYPAIVTYRNGFFPLPKEVPEDASPQAPPYLFFPYRPNSYATSPDYPNFTIW